jgi:hypothetical protein
VDNIKTRPLDCAEQKFRGNSTNLQLLPEYKMNLSRTQVIEWIAHFDLEEQLTARNLLSNILEVGAGDLTAGLRAIIRTIAEERPGPVALYAERHIRRNNGKPNKLFKETRAKRRRAHGNGPVPVPQGKPYARETGSEGVIATLITGLARAEPELFLDHPGPDTIRKRRVRSYVVVTDFIGSGRRACANLEAAWQIRSFKSWHSGQLRFEVAAFSGTVAGVREVERHCSRAGVRLHRGCPVIDDIEPAAREDINHFCHRHAHKNLPIDRTALGYGNAGALIVFDHGIPNNAPLLLHTDGPNSVSLFPRRSTTLLGSIGENVIRREQIDRSLANLRQARLARAPRFAGIPEHEQDMMLLLTALKRRPRRTLAVSARTGLSVLEVDIMIEQAQIAGYVDDDLRLTKAAYEALTYLKMSDVPPRPLPKIPQELYCPNSLRPPR